MVRMIAPLYGLENELRESNAPPQEIVKSPGGRPGKPLRNKLKKPVEYAQKRQAMLTTWLEDAHIPMDNNRVERAVRPVTVGRRNRLFLGFGRGRRKRGHPLPLLQECERCKADALA